MSEESEKKLDFSLPERPQPKAAKSGGIAFLLVVLIGLAGANLYLTWSKGGGEVPVAAVPQGGMPAAELKQLALKLEKQGLSTAAAGAWVEYLAAAGSDGAEVKPASIWYRIGTLYQDAEAHEDALAAFYRSESLGSDEELSSEIGRRVQGSLEALGKFAALKHELTERVGLEKDAGAASEVVVAEIGTRKITQAELDREIESSIATQLSMYAGQVPEEKLKQQQEAALKKFTSSQERLQFLNSFVVQEILYRKARESKLMENPAVRAQLRDAERALLARQLMESELRGKVNISESDLSNYYEAHKNEFQQPASAGLSHILVAEEEEANQVIARILAGEDFAALASELSLDTATKDKGGVLLTPAMRGQPLANLQVEPSELEALFEAKAGDILDKPVKSKDGYHVFQVRMRGEEQRKTLEEVRDQIYRQLYTQKEGEMQTKLLQSLQDEYDVVVHQEVFGPPKPTP